MSLVKSIRRLVGRVASAYDRVQVELQGQYSLARLQEFVTYEDSTPLWWAIAIVALTPVPCLLTIILLDLTPLNSAYLGVSQQTEWLWFRVGFSVGTITMCIILQLHQSAPSLPMSTTRLLTISLLLGVTGAGDFVALGFVIGFPTPFSLQIITLAWFCKLATALWISWIGAARVDHDARKNLGRYLLAYSSEMVVVFAYPIYYYVFTLLTGTGQTAFSLILPIMKLTFKNLVSYGMLHMEDLAPTTIVFNIDVFHALFLSTTAQKSKSIGSTMIIMGVDAFQMMIAFSEIHKVQRRYNQLCRQLDRIDAEQSQHGDVAVQQKLDPIAFACHVLDTNSRIREHPDLVLPRHLRRSPLQIQEGSSVTNLRLSATSSGPSQYSDTKVVPTNVPLAEQPTDITNCVPPSELQPTPAPVSVRQDSQSTPQLPAPETQATSMPAPLTRRERIRVKSIACVLQLLHMTEFYMLIEFAEVMMSMLFATYLSVITRLPNRVHYVNLIGLSDAELHSNTQSVAVFAAMELVSFFALCIGLNRTLPHFSSIRQLAFALRKHRRMAQSMLLLWVLFVVQLSLTHAGTDYTFEFAWLHTSSSSVNTTTYGG